MVPAVEYRFCRDGDWNLLVHPQTWSQGLWEEILQHLNGQVSTHHPQTKRLHYPADGTGQEFYLKIYHRSDLLGTIKDLFRTSRAVRALRQGEALLREGFHTPLPLAAGEKRTFRFIKKAFLLTLRVDGIWLPLFLQQNYFYSRPRSLKKKMAHLRQLSSEIRRLHQSGFVHDDLTPYNILVQANEANIAFFYMDHDRTRRYPSWFWFLHILQKRNLVQLNRFVLPGISLQDRMRFLRYYLGERVWGRRERRLIRWLARRKYPEKAAREREHRKPG